MENLLYYWKEWQNCLLASTFENWFFYKYVQQNDVHRYDVNEVYDNLSVRTGLEIHEIKATLQKLVDNEGWHFRNGYPECLFNEWSKKPKKNQRVQVKYSSGVINDNVWFYNDNFVNKTRIELHNIICWKEFEG